MPFELTHVAIAQQVLRQKKRILTQQLLAGLLYPDVRYPFSIDRTLTHTMAGLLDPTTDDFAYGVQLHLLTDTWWDYYILTHGDVNLREVPDKSLFIGLLKIVHDMNCYENITQPAAMAALITQSTIPTGLPVTPCQWQEWTAALSLYLKEGLTNHGVMHMVAAMKYVDPVVVEAQRGKMAQFKLRYTGSLLVGFEAVVSKLSRL